MLDKPLRISYSDLVSCVIAFLRESKGPEVGLATRAALAKSIGITPGPYGKIEHGKTVPTVSHLFRIATSLGLSPSEILLEADRHLAAVRAIPGVAIEGSFDSESAEVIERDVEKNGFRIPRGALHFFVVAGYRSWRAITPMLRPYMELFERLNADAEVSARIQNALAPYIKNVRWVDYEAFVNELMDTKEMNIEMRKIVALRRTTPDGIPDADVDELIAQLSAIDPDDLAQLYQHSISVDSLKTKKAKYFASLTRDFIGAIPDPDGRFAHQPTKK